MVTLIVFEIVDVSATLAAAGTLLRGVVARPAIGWTTPAAAESLDEGAELAATNGLTADIDASEQANDGITWPNNDGIAWPEPTWSRLASQPVFRSRDWAPD